MKLYQFTVPAFYTRGYFEEGLTTHYGGFTRVDGYGSWLDKGNIINEQVGVYTVAVPNNYAGMELSIYVEDYLTSHGQAAMFWAEIGTAEIINLWREKAHA